MKSITYLIYADDGASKNCVDGLTAFFNQYQKKAETVLAHELSNQLAEKTVLIMPGGRSLPFYEKLGESGNRLIREFVMDGGVYVGFCAGAYYACKNTIFAEHTPLALHLKGELNFFNGNAIGPVFLPTQFAYQSENGACIAQLISEDKTTYSSYFNGGCYFDQAEKDPRTQVLLSYSDNQKPALIRCAVGSGHAILCGVHPELSARHVEDMDDAKHRQLKRQLTAIDESRITLLEKIFNIKLF